MIGHLSNHSSSLFFSFLYAAVGGLVGPLLQVLSLQEHDAPDEDATGAEVPATSFAI